MLANRSTLIQQKVYNEFVKPRAVILSSFPHQINSNGFSLNGKTNAGAISRFSTKFSLYLRKDTK